MINEKRLATAPVQHIRNLLNSIKDGVLTVTYYDPIDPLYTRSYDVSCSAADADEFIAKYEALVSALEAIGKVREKIDAGVKAEDVLTPDQIVVWNTYISGYDKDFDAGEHNLDELYVRQENEDELSDEERKVLERYYEWFEEQCLKRFPKKTYSPKFLVNRAQRYVYFVCQNAPRLIIDEEGRCLAEEMILYYSVK